MLKYIKNKNIKKGIAPLLFLSTLVLAADCGNSKPPSSKNLKKILKNENPAPIATAKSNTTHVIPAAPVQEKKINSKDKSAPTRPTPSSLPPLPPPPPPLSYFTGKKVSFNVNKKSTSTQPSLEKKETNKHPKKNPILTEELNLKIQEMRKKLSAKWGPLND